MHWLLLLFNQVTVSFEHNWKSPPTGKGKSFKSLQIKQIPVAKIIKIQVPQVLKNALKGQWTHSPGQRPGYMRCVGCALKGQKPYEHYCAFALSGRTTRVPLHPGQCPGLLAYWPFRPLLFMAIVICGSWIIKIWKIWIDLWDFCPTGLSFTLFAE